MMVKIKTADSALTGNGASMTRSSIVSFLDPLLPLLATRYVPETGEEVWCSWYRIISTRNFGLANYYCSRSGPKASGDSGSGVTKTLRQQLCERLANLVIQW